MSPSLIDMAWIQCNKSKLKNKTQAVKQHTKWSQVYDVKSLHTIHVYRSNNTISLSCFLVSYKTQLKSTGTIPLLAGIFSDVFMPENWTDKSNQVNKLNLVCNLSTVKGKAHCLHWTFSHRAHRFTVPKKHNQHFATKKYITLGNDSASMRNHAPRWSNNQVEFEMNQARHESSGGTLSPSF